MIYHIADTNFWEQAQSTGMYTHPSLHAEGFIHCSTASQLEPTANLYFASFEKILVLFIDPSLLTSEVVNEPATRGEEFPHIYGPVNNEAVVKTRTFKRNAAGKFKIAL